MTDPDFATMFALGVLPKDVDKLSENIRKANDAAASRLSIVSDDK